MGQQFGAPPKPQSSMPGWAWCIIIPSVGCFIGVPVLAAILFPVFAQARERARSTSCISNVKVQSLANLMYSQDYDETFPGADKWMDYTTTYRKSEIYLHCPTVSRSVDEKYGYAYNQKLSRKQLATIAEPQTTPMLYDSSDLERNASDDVSSLPAPARHVGTNSVGYSDGHARRLSDGSRP